jgi:hypothetical protein
MSAARIQKGATVMLHSKTKYVRFGELIKDFEIFNRLYLNNDTIEK